MSISEFAAILVAIAVVVVAVILVVAVNNLNRTLAKLEDTAHQLRDEGIGAFRELRQLVAEVRLEVRDLALRQNHQQFPAYYDELLGQFYFTRAAAPAPTPLAIASGSSKVARGWLGVRRRRKAKAAARDAVAT